MFDIIGEIKELFNTTALFDYKEIMYEFSCEMRVGKENIPLAEALTIFANDKPDQDKLIVSLSTSTDTTYVVSGNSAVWLDSYKEFVDGADDEINVSIKIEKGVTNGSINVYKMDAFSRFLESLGIEDHLYNFTKLFSECGDRVAFRLMDINGSLRTSSIVFSDNRVQWESPSLRANQLKYCGDASVFLDRNKICLIPQDFIILEPIEGSGFDYIQDLFTRLSRILSYIYLANTSSVMNGKAILQFDVAVKGDEYSLDDLSRNEIITKIYDWSFSNNNSVEMASIARKVINIYCRSQGDVLKMGEKVLNSIKSDYMIYSKNHVDQYIEMKNKISEFIVDSIRQMQELSHDMSSAIRNNFVAIVVFILTVLLTDSIDIAELTGNHVPLYVVCVCGFFSLASVLYLIATVMMAGQKWNWLDQSYNNLKDNYIDTLDEKDIDEAFRHDAPLKTTKGQYDSFKKRIVWVWITMIILMFVFTGLLAFKYITNTAEKSAVVAIDPLVIGITDQETTATSEDACSFDVEVEGACITSQEPPETIVEQSD